MISVRPALILLIVLLATAPSAEASLFKGETLDKAANIIALFILFVVPIVLVALFWMVHVIPEKIAEKNHHPQQAAIKTLCLLSLVFGGLLWPIAWLLAYTKPIGYKLAYGTDKHPHYFKEAAERAEAGLLSRQEMADIRTELEGIAARGHLTSELRTVRDRVLARLQAAGTVEQP